MKKFFVSLALAAFCVFANAQVVIPVQKGKGLLKKSSEKIIINNPSKVAPKKAASLEGTTKWGYFLGDIDETGGIGIGSAATFYAGYFVPGDGILKGSSINGVNLPVYATTNLTNLSIWISEDLETNLVNQRIDAKTLTPNSFNAIALDEPFAIPEGGVFVGVKLTVPKVEDEADAFPIACGGNAYFYSLILKFSSANGSEDWADYSGDFGSFAMQLFCSGLTQSDRHAYFSAASTATTLPGAEVSIPAIISSDGKEDVRSIDYTIEINGNKISKRVDLTTPIAGGFGQTGIITVDFTAPETYGAYTTNISIEKVNGKSNDASENVLAVPNKVVTRAATRRTVVEEFTGTGCGWCPRGWVGMEYMKEHLDNFIGIAFHQYNASDPMYVPNYCDPEYLGIYGAPGCAMDRKLLGIDPYYGSDESIVNDFNYCNAMLPDVDVTVSGTFNADFTAVDVTANVEYLTDGDNYTVVYVLTADGLKGTTSLWRQTNYYADYSAADVDDPSLAPFCQEGIYGSSSVSLTFNDVMIGSSYNDYGTNMAPALTGQVQAGVTATGTYTISMPTKAMLKNAINNDEVYAVALVIASDGTIANAARAKVLDADAAAGIVNAGADFNAAETARYNAAGQVISGISGTQKGLNIIKLSNGKTVKVIVK